MLGEVGLRGGVCPRCPRRLADFEVGCVSEEDRSGGAGLLENSLRKALPTLEDRLFARVSSLSKQYVLSVGPRTIPEDGTADNLLMSMKGLVETSTGAPAPETSLESSSGK